MSDIEKPEIKINMDEESECAVEVEKSKKESRKLSKEYMSILEDHFDEVYEALENLKSLKEDI